jgi:hypothetical protein
MYVVTARFMSGRMWREEHLEWQEALKVANRWRAAGAQTKVRYWPSLAEADRAE